MRDAPRLSFDVDLSVAEVLGRITSVTEREVLPFISASATPRQRDKEFVSSVSANTFRIWKVPSSTRSRQKICYPYLHGVVQTAGGGSRVAGSFKLHPFNKLIPLFPLTVLVPGWMAVPKTAPSLVLASALTAAFAIVEVASIRAALRILPREQRDIELFLVSLFAQPGTGPGSGA